MENVEEVKKKSKKKESRYGKRYGIEFKLRCVKLRLEEGVPIALLSKEAGARYGLGWENRFQGKW